MAVCRIRSGAAILPLEVGTPAPPWTRFAGTLWVLIVVTIENG
jgi:hypothetical protein